MEKQKVNHIKEFMKKVLVIIAIPLLASCKTEILYLTVFPIKKETEMIDTRTIYKFPDNRFRREFYVSDSIFSVIEKSSNDAMKSAIYKTKHLIK